MNTTNKGASNPLRFDGRVIIVTGGGGGMGRAHAMLLASRGARVVVNDIGLTSFKGGGTSADPAEAVAREITAAGGEAIVSLDSVATPEGSQAVVDAAVRKWGRLDGILHNAAIARFASIESIDLEDYRAVVAVSLDAALYLTKSAWPIMRAQNYGKLVYVTSAGGLIGTPNNSSYAIAKTGLFGLMNVARFEGARHNITVNLLGVGAYTRMVKGMFGDDPNAKRMDEWWQKYMSPDLVAPAAAWLLHEECVTTGAIINAQGGHVSRSFLAETRGYTDLNLSLEAVRDHQREINEEPDYRAIQTCEELQALMIADLTGAGAEQLGVEILPFDLRS